MAASKGSSPQGRMKTAASAVTPPFSTIGWTQIFVPNVVHKSLQTVGRSDKWRLLLEGHESERSREENVTFPLSPTAHFQPASPQQSLAALTDLSVLPSFFVA